MLAPSPPAVRPAGKMLLFSFKNQFPLLGVWETFKLEARCTPGALHWRVKYSFVVGFSPSNYAVTQLAFPGIYSASLPVLTLERPPSEREASLSIGDLSCFELKTYKIFFLRKVF